MMCRMDETRRLIAKPELTTTVRQQGRLQTWMAALIGRDKMYITHMMKGRRPITDADARILAAALGRDVRDLFDSADATEHVAKETVAA